MQNYSSFNETCCSVYSDEYMSSSGYTYYETRQQRRRAKNELGRSMVEMLGVLAVIGVLSVAGVAGFKTAMDKHRSNELMNEASKRAVIAMAQLAQGRPVNEISFAEFTNNTVAGATFDTSAVVVSGTNKFGVKVSNVEKGVCQNLVNMAGGNVYVAKFDTPDTHMTASQCANNKEQNVLAFIYDSDNISSSTPNTPNAENCDCGQYYNGDSCVSGNSCYDDGCILGYFCSGIGGECLECGSCNEDWDCMSGYRCISGQCEYDGGATECCGDWECSGGYCFCGQCMKYACGYECCGDYDCDKGHFCIGGQCVWNNSGFCNDNWNCVCGDFCNFHECLECGW